MREWGLFPEETETAGTGLVPGAGSQGVTNTRPSRWTWESTETVEAAPVVVVSERLGMG